MKIKIYYLVVILLFFISCGPSAEEKAEVERMKMDSVAKAAEANTLAKVQAEQEVKAKLERDSIARAELEDRKAKLTMALSDKKTELRMANEKLSQIKEFHMGRLNSEKEAQVNAQLRVIQSLEDEMQALQTQFDNISQQASK
jgi:hypothetical protein